MRKTILAIAAIVTLTVGEGFAQRYKSHEVPAVYNSNSRGDNAYEEYQINRLDQIVKLSRKQERQIRQIENRYDRLAAGNRRLNTLQGKRRLEEQKSKEIVSVLNPVQRQRLFAYQQSYRKFNRRG